MKGKEVKSQCYTRTHINTLLRLSIQMQPKKGHASTSLMQYNQPPPPPGQNEWTIGPSCRANSREFRDGAFNLLAAIASILSAGWRTRPMTHQLGSGLKKWFHSAEDTWYIPILCHRPPKPWKKRFWPPKNQINYHENSKTVGLEGPWGPMVYIINSRIISKPTSWFDLVNSHYFDLRVNSFSTPPENLELNLGNKTCICTAEHREYEIIRGIVAPTACSKLYISCSVIQACP